MTDTRQVICGCGAEIFPDGDRWKDARGYNGEWWGSDERHDHKPYRRRGLHENKHATIDAPVSRRLGRRERVR